MKTKENKNWDIKQLKKNKAKRKRKEGQLLRHCLRPEKSMKATVLTIVIGALRMILKGLLRRLEVLEIGRRADTIQTIALLRSARILRRVLETWGDLFSDSSWILSVNSSVKNSQVQEISAEGI